MKIRYTMLLKKLHRWMGVGAALILLLFAISGILLNQRKLVAPYSISRNVLPKEYRFHDWNLAAVKGAVETDEGWWFYGDIGVWHADHHLRSFTPVHEGMARGAGNRKTFHMLETSRGNLYAATFSELYHRSNGRWHALPLPVSEQLVRSIREVDGKIYVLTRSNLIKGSDDPDNPRL